MSTETRICLAIATFRFDDHVIDMLTDLVERHGHEYFDEVLVVDSIGTGELPRRLDELGFSEFINYECHDTNLGSAGNLAKRLRRATELDCDWVFAINHDGMVCLEVVDKLRRRAEKLDRVGAAYPLRFLPQRGQWDLTGTRRMPLPFKGTHSPPLRPLIRTFWSSSNGALYNLEAVREGLLPWSDLWMGWEDLAYGLMLEDHGWRQFIVTDAQVEGHYEYTKPRGVPDDFRITDKPSWYAYYHARNLVTIAKRNGNNRLSAVVAARLLLEAGLTTVFRDDKKRRFNLLGRGLSDGLRERLGKGPVP